MSPPDSLLSQKSVTQANKAVMHLSAAIPLGGGGCTFVAECRSAELCSLLRIHIIYFSKQCLLKLEEYHLISLNKAQAALISASCFGPQRDHFMPEDRNARTQWWSVNKGPFLESPETSGAVF